MAPDDTLEITSFGLFFSHFADAGGGDYSNLQPIDERRVKLLLCAHGARETEGTTHIDMHLSDPRAGCNVILPGDEGEEKGCSGGDAASRIPEPRCRIMARNRR